MGKSWLIEGKATFKILMQSRDVGKQKDIRAPERGLE